MTTNTQRPGDQMIDTILSPTPNILDNASDYGDFGSDAEEVEILDILLARVAPESKEDQALSFQVTDIEDYEPPQGVLLPKDTISVARHYLPSTETEARGAIPRVNIEVPSVDTERSTSQEPEPADSAKLEADTRSPLERFRKPPKKALSVTDLVSPAWCELQYLYTLSKHGRKRRTPAMKQGSAVHQALEDEVHTTVPIETTKIEDSWGLRIWNICQGLHTLRETGRTRELEIWGTIGGELVNGIIDELSYDCPDPNYEEQVRKKGVPMVDLPEYQSSITEYLLAKPKKEGAPPVNGSVHKDEKWIYITDVKTRATPTLPTGSSLRPTIVQLHLYHHMLENLAQGNFSLRTLADRYKLNVDEPFSDSFLAQLADLTQHEFSDASQEFTDDQFLTGTEASSQDSTDVLLRHNTLSLLWDFMMSQFRKTFLLDESRSAQPSTESGIPSASQQSTSDLSPPPTQPTRLSTLLTATYLAANYKHSPSKSNGPQILGRKSFPFNSGFLYSYLSESLSWWRGERDAKGVALQEAWKCRSCDFRNDCSWIMQRDQASFDEAMRRKKMRELADSQPNNENEKVTEITRSNV